MQTFKPLEKITVPSNDANDPIRKITKGRPVVTSFRNDLDKLAQMLFVKGTEKMTQTEMVHAMTCQLEGIPYIPFPISFSTVDMVGVTYKMIDGKKEPFILLGRRSEKHLWQFPGGFRDPRERNQEAARREYIEETSLDLPLNRFKFLDDMFIDDRRYRDTPHKITTHVFLIKVLAKEAKKALACDDIFEVRWFSVNELRQNRDNIVRDVHTQLFNLVEKHIK